MKKRYTNDITVSELKKLLDEKKARFIGYAGFEDAHRCVYVESLIDEDLHNSGNAVGDVLPNGAVLTAVYDHSDSSYEVYEVADHVIASPAVNFCIEVYSQGGGWSEEDNRAMYECAKRIGVETIQKFIDTGDAPIALEVRWTDENTSDPTIRADIDLGDNEDDIMEKIANSINADDDALADKFFNSCDD